MNQLEVLKKKLIYKSEHRGSKENDLLLGQFTKKYIDKLDYCELKMLDSFLDESDLDIFNWISSNKPFSSNHYDTITKLLQDFNYCNK